MTRICPLLLVALLGTGDLANAEPPGKKDASPGPAATASNALAIDLYGQLVRTKSDESLFFSPYSISNALVIVAEGARGETADEMGKVLHFPNRLHKAGDRPWDLDPIHSGLAALNKQFEAASGSAPQALQRKVASLRQDLDKANREVRTRQDQQAAKKARRIADEINKLQATINPYEVLVANALWAEKTYPFKQSYLNAIDWHYGASAFPVDFINASKPARQRINAWVEKQTRQRIKNLIPPKAVDDTTRLVVTNAIYFKGEWVEPFKKDQTKPRDFTLAGGKKVKVATMHGYPEGARYSAFNEDGTFFDTPTYAERGADTSKFYPGAGGFEVLEMPYKGGDLSMVVLLPRSTSGLGALEKKLSDASLQTWLGKLKQRSVEVYLPKYRLESSFDLKQALEALGMKRAFQKPGRQDGAQFDGMSEAKSPDEKLYITKVLHKAFVEVSEKGTEAAAATAVILAAPGAAPAPAIPFTPTFRADRPFVFLIRDQKTGTILFLGRQLEPGKGA
jgi:serine protease inhibitor